MKLTDHEIETLIPQRPPIVMVDCVVDHCKSSVTTQFEIKDSNYFIDSGAFTESGLLENIAQTAAGKVGLECKLENKEVPIGFIGGINRVVIHQLPKPGDLIRTKVDVLQEVFNISLISGKCYLGEELLIECQMKIVINP